MGFCCIYRDFEPHVSGVNYFFRRVTHEDISMFRVINRRGRPQSSLRGRDQLRRPLPKLHCFLRILFANSMPASTMLALVKDLKPSILAQRRLIAR